MRRALIATAAVAALTAVAPTATAGGAPTPEPTSGARSAGITEPGQAYMGWRERGTPLKASQLDTSAARESGVTATVNGIDVSNWQGQVDWAGQRAAGKRFAYVKATEGTSYKSPSFSHQYTGSYTQGFIRGSYHFALPDRSSGTAQADWFVNNGGGWSADGKTLPGALDMEWNPYGATCFGKTQAGMVTWIQDFVKRYKARTGRAPVIYTNTNWWNQCVGHDTRFAAEVPLWIARYSTAAGTLPTGWSYYTFWQYSDTPIDQNVFNGSLDRLRALATG